MDAIKVFKNKKCTIVWKYIVFKHNQHQIKKAKDLSASLGFDRFKLEFSDRWLGNKDLMPDSKYVDHYYEHQKTTLTDATYETDMKPVCLQNNLPTNELYIDAEGDFYPCCWMGTHRYKYKSMFSPKQKQFNIKNNSLKQIPENSNIKEFFASTKQFTSAHECCKIQCGVKNG